MSQVDEVTQVLKRQLKQQGMTYKLLAHKLEMSEANVKRMFAKQAFSLQRLEQICLLLKLDLSELFIELQRQKNKISTLTKEQEQQLVNDPKLLLVAVCLRDAWTFEEITNHYDLDQHQCIQLMAKLDKLQMIEMLPDNRYRLLIAQDFKWISNGPLERFITHNVLTDFLAASFKGEQSYRFYLPGTYAQSSVEKLLQRLDDITREAAQLNQQDAKLPVSQRTRVGILLAMRPWELEHFTRLRRTKGSVKKPT
ncbi:MAG: helix-turn-helix domain-containing protein [Pseudomonadales bacterium]